MLQRSENACYEHWNTVLLPIIKTHELGLPQDHSWQNNILNYIVREEITNIEDLDLHYLETKLCPGQTIHSIKRFLQRIRRIQRYTEDKKDTKNQSHESCPSTITKTTEPLWVICMQWLESKRGAKQSKQRMIDISDIYDRLSKKFL